MLSNLLTKKLKFCSLIDNSKMKVYRGGKGLWWCYRSRRCGGIIFEVLVVGCCIPWARSQSYGLGVCSEAGQVKVVEVV